MIHNMASAVKCHCNSAIAESALVFSIDRRDYIFYFGIFIWQFQSLVMVVIRSPGKRGYAEEYIEFVLLPQFRYDLCFLSRCTLSDTKAFNFFR